MLLVDARAHGQSEGKFIGFGCKDRYDALKWIDWMIKKAGNGIRIVLMGNSMGGATVLMASGLNLPEQVKELCQTVHLPRLRRYLHMCFTACTICRLFR